jgi:hypothetical protein
MSPAPTRHDGERPVPAAGTGTGPEHQPESSGAAQRRREAQRWLRRRRLERTLHDGASLRLSALTLRLGLLPRAVDEREWRARIGEMQDELHQVLQELREVAGQIYPPLLDQAGLAPALRELAERLGTELDVEVTAGCAGRRYGAVAEGAAYFAVAECLAEDRSVRRARLLDEPGALVFTLDGVGAPCLARVLDQVRPLGGTAEPHGPTAGEETPSVPGGQTITVRIPCE